MDKDIIIQNLLEENRLLRLQVLELTETIKSLKLEIQQLKTRKNINNSSTAPSVDLSRKNKTLNLQKALTKNRKFFFSFLYNTEVPPDNNGSERAVRNIKVKQKISEQLKTSQNTFYMLHSIIDTRIKNKVDIIETLNHIAKIQFRKWWLSSYKNSL